MMRSGMGAPAMLHASWSGPVRTDGSIVTQSSWIHVTKLGRKLPEEARQRQAMSDVEQVVSGDLSMQLRML